MSRQARNLVRRYREDIGDGRRYHANVAAEWAQTLAQDLDDPAQDIHINTALHDIAEVLDYLGRAIAGQRREETPRRLRRSLGFPR